MRIRIALIFVLLTAVSLTVYAKDEKKESEEASELLELFADQESANEQEATEQNSDTADSNVVSVTEQVKEQSNFSQASASIQKKLQDSIDELNRLREQVIEEKVPLSRKLRELQSELLEVRQEYKDTTRMLDSRTLDLSNLRERIKDRKQEASYLSHLLGEYINKFESRLHIAEIQLYKDILEPAKLAPENKTLSEKEIYEKQAALLTVSLDRLFDAFGGVQFKGHAVDSTGDGLVKQGTFSMIGPIAIFKSDDGQVVGTIETRLNSLEPTIIPFSNILDTEAASNVISNSSGMIPIDPSLGNAYKLEKTKETFIEHAQKGGVVMIPIFALAGAALLVALYKAVFLLSKRKPSARKIRALLNAVTAKDEKAAMAKAKSVGGPVGKMLVTGVEHIKEPRELIEEIMYEKVLATRLKLQRFLPFIAISAASAPLLGLLGTVTGIIKTFKLITVFGSGDASSLSGGIAEALITTEFGLIVAIPSLLLHAFLSRKAKSIINQMEQSAVIFVNHVSKTIHQENDAQNVLSKLKLTASQTEDILKNIRNQAQLSGPESVRPYSDDTAGAIMNTPVISVNKTATVAEAIDRVRNANISDDVDNVFVVDEYGKFAGQVMIHQLLTKPEQTQVEALASANTNNVFVRIDTHKNEVNDLFSKYDVVNMPVLDHEDQLVGWVKRNGNGDGK